MKKFYSTITNEVYDTEEELVKAEEVIEKKKEKEKVLKEKKAERAKEVEQAFKEAREAQEKANKILSDFCTDYGSFHATLKEANRFPFQNSLLDFMLNRF